MVEGQGGVCICNKQNRSGSRFSFRLDFKKAEEKTKIEAAENEETETRNKRRKCLVVEDMPLNQFLMKTLMNDFGSGMILHLTKSSH